jgi:hypothetical protein
MESKAIHVSHNIRIYIHSYVTNAIDPQFSQSNRRMLNKSQKYTLVQLYNLKKYYKYFTPVFICHSKSIILKNIRVMSPL